MKWYRLVLFFAYSWVLCGAEDISDVEETSSDEGVTDGSREMRNYNHEGWRAVETFPEGNSGWIPHEQPQDSEETIPKRRRIRKRKRRPATISLTDDSVSEETFDRPVLRRRIRPQNLPQIREPWEEISDEPARPYVRRRITPDYQPEEIITTSVEEQPTKFNPIAAVIRFGSEENIEDRETPKVKPFEDELVQETTKTPDLKTILKQNGGLSLSEVLQQKNLSLSELLMGNRNAISALTQEAKVSTEARTEPPVDTKSVTEPEMESTKYKRLPPSLRKTINRNYEQDADSFEALSTKETLEAQRKRLALLQLHKDKMFFEVTKFEVITEPTTEKRIFVPSHPKYYTSLDYKPDFVFPDQTTQIYIKEETTRTTRPTTTEKPVVVNKLYNRMKPKLKHNLPITSAKLNKLTQKIVFKENEEENYPKQTAIPPKAVKISIKDIFAFKEENQTEKKDEPLRMTIDLDNFVQKTTEKPVWTTFAYYRKSTSTTTESITTTTATTETPKEKLKPFTAKDEINEILKDPIGREKLSRILEVRKMTIEELVQQRERGSSQLHLADIFHNKTREPEPKEEPFVGHINSQYFNSLPVFDRQQKSLFNAPTTGAPTAQATSQNKEVLTVTSFPTFKIEVNKQINNRNESFLWKELYPDLFKNIHENNNQEARNIITSKPLSEDSSEEDIQRLDEVESTYSVVSNEKLNAAENEVFEEEVFINLPSGVKSAILASLAIVGLSLLVFLTILVIFRWTQRRKKLNYCNSFSSKIRSPILESGPKNLKNFVNETLGRKKNCYNKHLQSMSDDIWDTERKPSF